MVCRNFNIKIIINIDISLNNLTCDGVRISMQATIKYKYVAFKQYHFIGYSILQSSSEVIASKNIISIA